MGQAKQIPWVLAILFVGTFIMGCAEVIVVGALDLIAADLGAPIPQTGQLVTANALGIAVGGPILTLLTSRLRRRTVLWVALIAFVLFNLPAALGMGLDALIPARVAAGSVQGLFIAAAISTATGLSTQEKAGRAIAVVIGGFAVSGAIGMPLGAWAGQTIGWRPTFAAVAVVTVAVLVATVLLIPHVPRVSSSNTVALVRHAFAPPVLAVLAVGVLISAGVQTGLTYVVPFLAEQPRVTGPQVGLFLLAFGVFATVGSFIGGRFADSRARAALIFGAAGTAVALVGIYTLGQSWLAVGAGLGLLGFFSMAIAAPLQYRIDSLSGPGAALAASLPASAVNLGDAIGAGSGGIAISSFGIPAAMATGAAIATLATVTAVLTFRITRPSHDEPNKTSQTHIEGTQP